MPKPKPQEGEDPDPTPYLFVSLEQKRIDQTKPYDAKKACWVPDEKEGYVGKQRRKRRHVRPSERSERGRETDIGGEKEREGQRKTEEEKETNP